MFFEMRHYFARPGERDALVSLMESEIIPFFTSHGMEIAASFVAEDDPDLFVWFLRFEDDEQRAAVSASVYGSDTWKTDLLPKVGKVNDKERAVTRKVVPTTMSVFQ